LRSRHAPLVPAPIVAGVVRGEIRPSPARRMRESD
jgi:hypothetical protein